MKKVICLITVLLVCFSLACPAFAANEFVPSISSKGAPEIVTVKDKDGNEAVGVVKNASGEVISYVPVDALLFTPVSDVETETKIPDAARTQLQAIYKALSDGSMKLPYGDNVNAEDMVIIDLIDISWIQEGTSTALDPEGVVFEATFDLGVAKDDVVVVMTYKNNAWNEITKVVNNGDGTVTCTFEHLCPVSFSVLSKSATGTTPGTGDELGANLTLWVALMAVSAAAVVVIIASRRKVQK